MSFKYTLLGKIRYGNEIEDILKLKGITDTHSFLHPTEKNIESELLLDNIEQAAECLMRHIDAGSVIDIVVDCDCDGYTSAANIYQYIKRINPYTEINYYIHKNKEHGLSDVADELCHDKADLIIVPDAGSGDGELCREIISYRKDIIILDHHNIRDKQGNVPENPAIVVNNQYSQRVSDKAMTGVGITYKLTKLLDKYYHVNCADDYLDLAALGMIGDRADVTNLQTRYLILQGLNQIKTKNNKNKLISLMAEAQSYSMDNKITINGVGFYICPLINSLIRLGEYEDKCYMFEALCNSDKRLERNVRGKGTVNMSIQEYVLRACQSTNRNQKKLTEQSADAMSEEIKRFHLDELPVLICNAGDKVDANSTGLAANRLAGQYQRPCLLMRQYGDVCRGSGRGYERSSIQDFNKWCVDTGLFNKVQGHAEAFGCEIEAEKINDLFQLLMSMPSTQDPIYYVYNLYMANELRAEYIKNVAKYDYVWGNSVTEPLFVVKNIPCNKYAINLSGARQNRIEFEYHNIKFVKMTKGSSLADEYKGIISVGDNIKFDVVGRFNVDMKKGKTPQVLIDDWMYEKSERGQGFLFG